VLSGAPGVHPEPRSGTASDSRSRRAASGKQQCEHPLSRSAAPAQKEASGSRPAIGLRQPRRATRRDKRRLPLSRVRREVARIEQIREVGGLADAIALVSESVLDQVRPHHDMRREQSRGVKLEGKPKDR
jgi:hypothetical protein